MTPKMVPAFIKLVKFLFGVVVVFCLFIFFMVTAIASVPYLTTRHYKMNESPSYDFKVVLEFFYPSVDEPQFECVGWDDFKEMQPLAEIQNVYLSREDYSTCQGNTSVFEREYTTFNHRQSLDPLIDNPEFFIYRNIKKSILKNQKAF